MANKLRELRGLKIGKLRVLRRVRGKSKDGRPRYTCICDCGKTVIVDHGRLIHTRNPKSHCGCALKGPATLNKVEYHTWWDMVHRCHDPKHPGYGHYGAKGITVCDRWRDSFEHFLSDLGKRPKGHSIDRIDPHGNYVLENVRWATDKVQGRNKKTTRYVIHPKTGEKVTIGEMSEYWGCTYQKAYGRLIELGLYTPGT